MHVKFYTTKYLTKCSYSSLRYVVCHDDCTVRSAPAHAVASISLHIYTVISVSVQGQGRYSHVHRDQGNSLLKALLEASIKVRNNCPAAHTHVVIML